jgi:hypothetical protein
MTDSSSSSLTAAERILADAAQGGTVLAYQVGVRYPRCSGADREALAAVFEAHGFTRAASRLRGVTPHTALTHVAGRAGKARRDGLTVVAIKRKAGDHVQAFAVCRATEKGRVTPEDVEHLTGARVFSHAVGIEADAPVTGAEDPACRALANLIAAEAIRIAQGWGDVAIVSKALTCALEDARALPFLSRGSYCLRATDPAAERIAACYREITETFYDATRRSGIRCTVVEIAGAANVGALQDTLIDDAESQALALIDQFARDRANGALQAKTLDARRATTQALVDSVRPVRDLLGSFAARLERITSTVLAEYEAAKTSADLAFPDWLATEQRDLASGAAATDDAAGAPVAETEADPFRI